MPDDPEPSLWGRLFRRPSFIFPTTAPQPKAHLFADRLEKTLFIDKTDQGAQARDAMLARGQDLALVGTSQKQTGYVTLIDAARKPDSPITTLARPLCYLPETLYAGDALTQMRKAKTEIAILVDEQGHPASLIHLIALLDAWLETEDPQGDTLTLDNLPGSTPIEDVFDALDMPIPDIDVQTIGGWVMTHAGKIPSRGEEIHLDTLSATILDTSVRRIRRLALRKTGAEKTPDS